MKSYTKTPISLFFPEGRKAGGKRVCCGPGECCISQKWEAAHSPSPACCLAGTKSGTVSMAGCSTGCGSLPSFPWECKYQGRAINNSQAFSSCREAALCPNPEQHPVISTYYIIYTYIQYVHILYYWLLANIKMNAVFIMLGNCYMNIFSFSSAINKT